LRRRHGRPRVLLAVALLTALGALLAQPACARQEGTQRDAFAAYIAGDYDAAIGALRRMAAAPDADARVVRTLVAALRETGHYEDAESAVRSAMERPDLADDLAVALGDVLFDRGRIDDAERAYRRALDAGAYDANTARLRLAAIRWRKGDHEGALNEFDRFIDIYNNSERLDARDLIAVSDAVQRLSVRDAALSQDAIKALNEAIAEDDGVVDGEPVAVEARLRIGEVFLQGHQITDAQELFREVLATNPNQPVALLGMARAKNLDGSDEALTFVNQSLEVNPDLVPARVFLAQLLIDLEREADAQAEVDRALAVNPVDLEALSTGAAIRWLAGDTAGFESIRDRVLALSPGYSGLYDQIAELAVRQRRYAGAVELAGRAVRLDPTDWSAWGTLGLNQLRIGRIDDARISLETSFAGDPYNPWIKNTLDLMDTFGEYRTVRTPRFEFMLKANEADLLAPWITTLAEEAYDSLANRYGTEPPTPIRVEVYPIAADFSVRTVGLAGFGALGVSFGSVLAVNSPAALERGQFNWGSTFWHELAHAFTLAATDHRIPRWLTEGLSVLEERRARPGWGDDLTPEFVAAYENGALLPVSRLNNGFIRPKYPMQIPLSYFEASLVVEMIERTHGFETIRGMLRDYRDGRSEADVFRNAVGETPEQFDETFDDWFRSTYASRLEAIDLEQDGPPGTPVAVALEAGEPPRGDFFRQMGKARALLSDGKGEEARPYFERAKALFPEYVGPENPYLALARLDEQAGRDRDAAAELEDLTRRSDRAYDANIELAELLEKIGDPAGAAAALERAVFISPYEPALFQKLASLQQAADHPDGVVRARRALLALDPTDKAEAHYQLALALFNAGDATAARSEVLRSLEVAPNFDKAQELLLRLRSREPAPSSREFRP
jgi:tetratricopeptide (TPR) repeat protein